MVAAHCPDGAVWRYAYDPFGRRISKDTKGLRHDFLWDGDVIARETVNSRAADWFFEPRSCRPLARREGGALLWAADHDTWGSLRPLRKVAGAGDEDYWLTLSSDDILCRSAWP